MCWAPFPPGLPEEMNITLHSLLRGYAVFAVSSYDRLGHRCG